CCGSPTAALASLRRALDAVAHSGEGHEIALGLDDPERSAREAREKGCGVLEARVDQQDWTAVEVGVLQQRAVEPGDALEHVLIWDQHQGGRRDARQLRPAQG